MRSMIKGLFAATALLAASAVPALACAAPSVYAAPCGYYGGGYASGYSYARNVRLERLPTIAIPRWQAMPRYYHVNQGPVYSGPGNYAPVAVYREGGVSSPYGYGPVYGHHRHTSGPFDDLIQRHSSGVPHWNGPVIYSSAPRGPAYRHRAGAHRHHARHHHHHRHHHGAHRHHYR